MLLKQNTTLGTLTYSRQIIDQIIQKAFEEVKGRLWLANYRGGVSDVLVRLGGFESIAETRVEDHDGKLYILLYVVSRIGESITENGDIVMRRILSDVTEQLELPIDNIEIQVTGSVSKGKRMVRRDLRMNLRDLMNNRKMLYEKDQ